VRGALGLDTLTLVREGGEVLASASNPRAAGGRDESTFRLASRALAGQSVRSVRTARMRDERGARSAVVLEALCVARHGGAAIAAAGGQELEQRILAEVVEPGVTVQLVTDPAQRPAASPATRVLPVGDADPQGPVVVVTTDDAALRAALADLNGLLLLAAAFATFTAVFLALLLAPRVARPILRVAEAANQIAKGDRTVRIDARAGGETGRLVFAFNHMTAALEAADKRARRAERIAAWRDIARQMAHEIKNPLTPIQMAVEMLRKARERQLPDFDQLFDEETRIVLEEVARLRRLVENFSRFARSPRPRLEAVSVRDIVAHVVGLHVGGATEVTGEADPDPGAIRADREQLTQVLVNLVKNAAQAAEERAQKQPGGDPAAVHVAASPTGDGRVRITVDDNGPGIDPAVMMRLFEPYVTTKQGQGGTGLGLAIAYKIVHEHGGTITADSSPNGTRFEIVLPAAGPSPDDKTLDTEERMLSHG
jgi:signal transduction histidine kinase